MTKTKDNVVSNVDLRITVLSLGSGYLGFAIVGGVRVAGGRRNTAYEAATSVFAVLSGSSGDNSAAAIAIELLLANVSIDDIPELGAGN